MENSTYVINCLQNCFINNRYLVILKGISYSIAFMEFFKVILFIKWWWVLLIDVKHS